MGISIVVETMTKYVEFKQDIMNDVATHLDTMTTKKKHAKSELQLDK